MFDRLALVFVYVAFLCIILWFNPLKLCYFLNQASQFFLVLVYLARMIQLIRFDSFIQVRMHIVSLGFFLLTSFFPCTFRLL